MLTRPPQIRSEGPRHNVSILILWPVPDIGEVLAAGPGKAMGELYRRQIGQDSVDEGLGVFIACPGGSIIVGGGRSPAVPSGSEQIELVAAVPFRQPLSPVDLLHGVEEKDTTGEVFGPVPLGAEPLEAEDQRNVIHILNVRERHHAEPRELFLLGQVPQE